MSYVTLVGPQGLDRGIVTEVTLHITFWRNNYYIEANVEQWVELHTYIEPTDNLKYKANNEI